jgi:uncharacterized protein
MINSEEGDYEGVKKIIMAMTKSSDIDLKNDIGYTSLALSVKNGHSNVCKLLIKHGANVNSVNNADQTVIFIACWANQTELVKLLIENNADLNRVDK